VRSLQSGRGGDSGRRLRPCHGTATRGGNAIITLTESGCAVFPKWPSGRGAGGHGRRVLLPPSGHRTRKIVMPDPCAEGSGADCLHERPGAGKPTTPKARLLRHMRAANATLRGGAGALVRGTIPAMPLASSGDSNAPLANAAVTSAGVTSGAITRTPASDSRRRF
jgi:hypothetical protein